MLIEAPEIRYDGDTITVSARITLNTSRADVPDRLWYRFPRIYEPYLTDRADAFVTSMILPALVLGEDIEVRGTLSARLAYGLEEAYQRAFVMWYPERFKLVRISCDSYREPVDQPSESRPDGVLSPFSGGVDSFYTLWRNLPGPAAKPGTAISHLLSVCGFDIPVEDEGNWAVISRSHAELANSLGLGYIPVHTNIRHFTDRLINKRSWTECVGSALIGTALLFGRKFARFYVPSGFTHVVSRREGTLPEIDVYLSSETLEVFHHGAGVTRVEKISAIADWPETYSRLRVCWEHIIGNQNCCRCFKCIGVMASLAILDRADRYSSFPLPLRRADVRNRTSDIMSPLLLKQAVLAGKGTMAADLRYRLFWLQVAAKGKAIKDDLRRMIVHPLKKRFGLMSFN